MTIIFEVYDKRRYRGQADDQRTAIRQAEKLPGGSVVRVDRNVSERGMITRSSVTVWPELSKSRKRRP